MLSFLPKKDVHSVLVALGRRWEPSSTHAASALLKHAFPELSLYPARLWLMRVPRRAITPALVRLAVRAGADVNANNGQVLLMACGQVLGGSVLLDRSDMDEQTRCTALESLLDAGADPRLSGGHFTSEPSAGSTLMLACNPMRVGADAPGCFSPRILRALERLVSAGAPSAYHALCAIKRHDAHNEHAALSVMKAAPKWFKPMHIRLPMYVQSVIKNLK
jgi:hypothetical protein